MLKQLKIAISITLVLTLITGFIYPMLVTVFAQIFFPHQANGSLVVYNNKTIGSKLIGQNFEDAKYFHSRPSESNYDATRSGGSNLGPTSKKLINHINALAMNLRRENPNKMIPLDLASSSASGLDPHITPEACEFQIPRIAKTRKIPEDKVRNLVRKNLENRQFGILGEPRVNVLSLNLELDQVFSKSINE